MTYMFKEKQVKLARMGEVVFGITDGTEEERARKAIVGESPMFVHDPGRTAPLAHTPCGGKTSPAEPPARFSEGLMRVIHEEGLKVLDNPNDYDIRANLMWAAFENETYMF